ncbi:MAG TPA: insulinase family protein [Polyangiaceae bacterium]|nr:insulinase family protein [Polyangiaceae bacterium]
MLRRALALAAGLVLLVHAIPARAELRADSTMAEGWRLANGLEVRVRHVPGAAGVAITLAYRAGSLYEPAKHEGLARLLAEVQFTAPVGDVPERRREEMDSVRPMGWAVTTNEHLALLTEVASPSQFLGVLHEVAQRAHGVTLTDAALEHARATVRRQLGEGLMARPDLALYYRVAALARGRDDEALLREASGAGFADLTTAQVSAQLARLYVPANAALAVVGDFSNVDVRALIEHEFGGIAAGTARRDTVGAPLRPGSHTESLAGLKHPYGALGIIAPALDDSLAPLFFLTNNILRAWWNENYGPPVSPLTTLFQYSPFDDARLARFYYGAPVGSSDPQVFRPTLEGGLDTYSRSSMEKSEIDRIRADNAWLLGGDLPASLRRLSATNAAPLNLLAITTATRACWRGDAFWNRFRERYEKINNYSHYAFSNWILDPKHEVALLLTPRP